MRIRLIRKLAERMNGVDVRRHAAGDVLDLPAEKALTLIGEGWAATDGVDLHGTDLHTVGSERHSDPVGRHGSATSARRWEGSR